MRQAASGAAALHTRSCFRQYSCSTTITTARTESAAAIIPVHVVSNKSKCLLGALGWQVQASIGGRNGHYNQGLSTLGNAAITMAGGQEQLDTGSLEPARNSGGVDVRRSVQTTAARTAPQSPFDMLGTVDSPLLCIAKQENHMTTWRSETSVLCIPARLFEHGCLVPSDWRVSCRCRYTNCFPRHYPHIALLASPATSTIWHFVDGPVSCCGAIRRAGVCGSCLQCACIIAHSSARWPWLWQCATERQLWPRA